MTDQKSKTSIVEQAVAEGGAYDIIRQRLIEQGRSLEKLTGNINVERQKEFGSTEMKVLSRLRLRTENNCQAKDLVTVGEFVLFGYNVFLGLKKETRIEDVFSVYQLVQKEQEYELKSVPINDSFLSDQRFQSEFKELYAYYKDTSLSQLVLKDNKLLASFQIGKKLSDIRVFRWEVSADGNRIEYIDNRGERDLKLPASHDFSWVECRREDVVDGRYSHINILDTLFVDCLRGDITIKIENNTNVGQGIYSEPVEEANQALDDGEFYYADLNQIILLKIRPYQEEKYRYLVFNRINQSIVRIDAIGDACQRLPEDHGIIFPGGYYLVTGEYKTFDDELSGLVFKRVLRSPNGEDVLYVFYQPDTNIIALYPYNMIEKSLLNPLIGHGYGFYEDGRMIIFYADAEPTRVHPIQIWQTPYFSEVYASGQPVSQSFYGKIGNSELVRGISELFSISKRITVEDVSANHYHALSKQCEKIFDAHYWLNNGELREIAKLLKQIAETAESVIDEYEKVESIREQSGKALAEAEVRQQELIRRIEPDSWHSPQEFVDALSHIRQHRGHLLTIREFRYIDVEKIDALDQQLGQVEQMLNRKTIDFLASKDALVSYYKDLETINKESKKAKTNAALKPHLEQILKISQSLDLISEMMASLKVDDATLQTQIVDGVSELYAQLNQQRAQLEHQRKSFGSAEATAQFAARLKLLNQSIHNALGLSSSPEKCDEQVSRLLVQLEELEGEFSEFDDFVTDIISKREEIFETFEAHKQTLVEARQRKAQSLSDAGGRILQSVQKRVKRFTEQDALNGFFAADGLVVKIREIIEQLNELQESVKAEDLGARLKSIKDQALRSLRDKSDLFELDGQVIKLGPRHKFSVNTQELDLTILPKDDTLYVRITGTDYSEPLSHEMLNRQRDYWSMLLPSETEQLYRAEYLAYQILINARTSSNTLDWQQLTAAATNIKQLRQLVTEFATPRYREGYEKGIHDHDAALILSQLIPAYESAGVLKYSPTARGIAAIYWANRQQGNNQELWLQRAKNATQMENLFADSSAKQLLIDEITADLNAFIKEFQLPMDAQVIHRASEYLVDELGQENVSFATTKYARSLVDEFKIHLESHGIWRDYQRALDDIQGDAGRRWAIAEKWLSAFVRSQNKLPYANFIGEAIGILNAEFRISRNDRQADIQFSIEGLLGNHPKINEQKMVLQLDDFLDRNQYHETIVIPGYEQYLATRLAVLNEQRALLRLEEFKAKPLTSFVRNRLINDVYLPIIGDNLAKQIGTVGENKRTDLMGLLLMISPPGYGKTTLMEYVADRLGLIFMKINCPVIGHGVTSVDPQQAGNSAARQELEKLNLALEMGNNVMLYLDDIQHTNSEFLQKFISLCDGTRRIEGVWQGRSKTYDMRGKKFCVVMAGNPYTESGEAFQIPDMLANRADIYNLGDVLSGKEEVFALSYIENALTSNPVLAPLANRDMQDVYKFIQMAKGVTIATTELSHQYSAAEVKEIVQVLQKMQWVQETVWAVNRQYIASSAQDDKYRTEPTFKLQGSYRNMNKMAEKISAIMTKDEMHRLVDDHYQGEAQLLTTGTEANLLKLAEIRQLQNEAQQQRWQQIKTDFMRNKSLGGDDADTGSKIVVQLNDLVTSINAWRSRADEQIQHRVKTTNPIVESGMVEAVTQLGDNIAGIISQKQQQPKDDKMEILAKTLQDSLQPLVKIMAGKLDLDLGTHKKMADINEKLEMIARQSPPKSTKRGLFGDVDSTTPSKPSQPTSKKQEKPE